jgi:acetoacetyl-CoA synthetase
MAAPLWQPSAERIERSRLTAFMRTLERDHGVRCADYAALHRWSIEEPELFWSAVWSFGGVIAETRGSEVVRDGERMPGARWFPEARLNFAENLLRRRDEAPALIFRGEDRVQRRMSFAELYARVSRLAQALRAWGVAPGDRVAGYLPNLPEAVVALLAASSLGAIWSSCSPDFGVRGVLDRFGQIEPKVLFTADGYFYNGAVHDSLARLAELGRALPSLERVVVVPYTREDPPLDPGLGAVSLDEALAPFGPAEIPFERLPFDHPVYILYSSGTTGAPKCIVHGAGGALLQHLKEHQLHADVQPGDRLFYFTTCGWMMWNWLVSGLASEATLLLYDGSPFHPDGSVLFDFAEQERMTIFGTSAKFIDAVAKAGLEPAHSHDLSSLKAMLSTGSPLAPESFDFVYRKISGQLCLSSISGGTDIVSCFVGGCPILPVWRGEIQSLGLGMRVDVFDEAGRPVRGEKGELVCTAPFPAMPVGFWNDPDGSRYHAAYFDKFPGVWCHGDFAELTEHGGVIIYGRSDAVLNPGGVRIGTAEIYRQVERIDEVLEGLVIGQEWEGDTRVVLFVRLREGVSLDEALVARIRDQVRRNASPRHVPARVIQVADIPRTKSGKIVELAVRDIVHGRPVKNREALANPEALDLFAELPDLAADGG